MGKDSFAKQLMKLNSSNYIIAYLDILGASRFMAEDSESFLNNLNVIYVSSDPNFFSLLIIITTSLFSMRT